MPPKQQEMDGIVQTLFHAMETKTHLSSTLLVLCGDHGMNDAGNHGASSPGETSPALVFLSPKLKGITPGYPSPALPGDEFDYYSKVEQSDLAPTIAALMGFPISKNNLGAFIPDFLPFWPSTTDKVQILLRNARQILSIVTAAFGADLFEINGAVDPCPLQGEVNELACEWRRISQQTTSLDLAAELDPAWITAMSTWLRKAQDLMSSMASNYDVPRLWIGEGLAILAMVAAISAAQQVGAYPGTSSVPLDSLTILYGFMMFASSYVEEEQHFWYWTSTLWLAFLGTREVQRCVTSPLARRHTNNTRTRRFRSSIWHILALVSFRLLRSWNQTGQKFAGEPDIVKLYMTQQPLLLWALVAFMYALVSFKVLPNLHGLPFFAITGVTSLLVSSAFSFKLAFAAEDAPELVVGSLKMLNDTFSGQTLVSRARVVFALLSVLTTFALYSALTGPPRAVKSSCTSPLLPLNTTIY